MILSILQTVLGSKDAVPDASLPEGSLQAFIQSASFTEEAEGQDGPVMSIQDFRKWCAAVPSVKKFLATLLKGPTSGTLKSFFFLWTDTLYFLLQGSVHVHVDSRVGPSNSTVRVAFK